MNKNPSIAVVGGGPGGLFCTYLLNQKVPNANITIYEGSSRLGGKIITDEFSDGSPFEAGVAELYEYLSPEGNDSKDPMRQLIEEDLGLETVDMSGGGVILHNKVLRDLDELGQKFGADTQACVQQFHRLVSDLMPLEKYANRWQPDNSHPWANKTFRQCICEATRDNLVARDYIEAAVASDIATESHTCNGLNGIKNVLMDNDKYMQVYHVVGGLEKIPESLVSKIQATIKRSTRITSVGSWNSSDGPDDARYVLTLQTPNGTDYADFDVVFVCLPNHWITQIKWEGEQLRTAIHRILEHYDLPAHYLRVSMLFDNPWWDRYRMPRDFWMMDVLNGCAIYNEKYRWRAKGGNVLSILTAGQDALLMCSGGQDDDEIVNYVIDNLPGRMRRQARTSLMESQVDRFAGSINAQPGGWPSKDLRTEHRPEPEQHPDLYLVGDYLFDSTLNAALVSANTATNLLLERMGIDWEKAELTEAVKELGGPEVALSMDASGHEHKGKGKGGGRFVSKGSGTDSPTKREDFADPKVFKATKMFAQQKIKSVPVPSQEAIVKARNELRLAAEGKIRAGGESRGGSAADRRKQRENLFKEFGGDERGWICCHGCGRKLHHTPPEGSGLERLERGKIFVKCQGGGYQLPNLLPECFACNRSRNDTQVRRDIAC